MKSSGIKLKTKSGGSFFHILCKGAGELTASQWFAISKSGIEQGKTKVSADGY